MTQVDVLSTTQAGMPSTAVLFAAPSASTAADAAYAREQSSVRVITDCFLLRRIVSFAAGWDVEVAGFRKKQLSDTFSWAIWYHLNAARSGSNADPNVFPKPRGTLPQIAIAEDNLEMLKLLHYTSHLAAFKDDLKLDFGSTLRCAIVHGRIEILEWLSEVMPNAPERAHLVHDLDGYVVDESVATLFSQWLSSENDQRSFLEIVKWLHVHEFAFTNSTVERAAALGHTSELKYMLEQQPGIVLEPAVLDKAAVNGHFDIVVYLHTTRSEGCTTYAMDGAVANGHLAVVKFLHEHRSEGCTTAAMDAAATRGELEVVEFLHRHRSEGCTTKAMDRAAACGHLDVVCFLDDNRSEGCTTKAMDIAAANGHLSVVQYLHTHYGAIGCTTYAMDAAARNGHLAIVQFLHEHRHEGCTAAAMDLAVWGCHTRIVHFLHENRHEGCTTEAMDLAAQQGNLRMVSMFHEYRSEGCTTEAMNCAAESGHLDVVQFLHENRSEGCTTGAMNRAAACGNDLVVKYLHANRSEGCTVCALDQAILNAHIPTAHFLLENRTEGCSDGLLLQTVINCALDVVRLVCERCDRGCLVEARAYAQRTKRAAAATLLSEYISEDVEACSLALHSVSGPRPCQRVRVEG